MLFAKHRSDFSNKILIDDKEAHVECMPVKVQYGMRTKYIDVIKLMSQLKSAINEKDQYKITLYAEMIHKISKSSDYKKIALYIYQELLKDNNQFILISALIQIEYRFPTTFLRGDNILKELLQLESKEWLETRFKVFFKESIDALLQLIIKKRINNPLYEPDYSDIKEIINILEHLCHQIGTSTFDNEKLISNCYLIVTNYPWFLGENVALEAVNIRKNKDINSYLIGFLILRGINSYISIYVKNNELINQVDIENRDEVVELCSSVFALGITGPIQLLYNSLGIEDKDVLDKKKLSEKKEENWQNILKQNARDKTFEKHIKSTAYTFIQNLRAKVELYKPNVLTPQLLIIEDEQLIKLLEEIEVESQKAEAFHFEKEPSEPTHKKVQEFFIILDSQDDQSLVLMELRKLLNKQKEKILSSEEKEVIDALFQKKRGKTLLGKALENNSNEFAALIVELNPNITAPSNGIPAIYQAVEKADIYMSNKLRKTGNLIIDQVNHTNEWTGLMIAIYKLGVLDKEKKKDRHNYEEMVKWLLKNGARLDHQIDGKSVFHKATEYVNQKTMHFLIKEIKNANDPETLKLLVVPCKKDGKTPLEAALIKGNFATAVPLMQYITEELQANNLKAFQINENLKDNRGNLGQRQSMILEEISFSKNPFYKCIATVTQTAKILFNSILDQINDASPYKGEDKFKEGWETFREFIIFFNSVPESFITENNVVIFMNCFEIHTKTLLDILVLNSGNELRIELLQNKVFEPILKTIEIQKSELVRAKQIPYLSEHQEMTELNSKQLFFLHRKSVQMTHFHPMSNFSGSDVLSITNRIRSTKIRGGINSTEISASGSNNFWKPAKISVPKNSEQRNCLPSKKN